MELCSGKCNSLLYTAGVDHLTLCALKRQHDALLDTCEAALDKTPSTTTPTPCLWVFYQHHRPYRAEKDLDFFRKAEARGWKHEEFLTEKIEVSNG